MSAFPPLLPVPGASAIERIRQIAMQVAELRLYAATHIPRVEDVEAAQAHLHGVNTALAMLHAWRDEIYQQAIAGQEAQR